MFLGVRTLAPLRIPNFKTPAPADERHLAFELEHFAKLIREKKPALLVSRAVLSAGMELPQKNAQIPRRDGRRVFGGGTDPGKLLRGHNEEKLSVGFRNNEELLDFAAAPARWNCDPMFVVELMTKLPRIKIER